MKRLLTIGAVAALALTGGCSILPGRSSVQGDWSCRAIGVSACHSIAENEARPLHAGANGRIVAGAGSDRAIHANDRPVFFGRHVMRISIASWVDDEGHYHAPTTVFAPVGDEMWGEPADPVSAGGR